MPSPITLIKPLPRAWKVGGELAKDVEVREPTMEDVLEAEIEAHPYNAPTKYRMALACRLIVRAGTFTGPFAVGHFKGMHPKTWDVITTALVEAEQLGEDEQPGLAPQS